jgi:hypothetical protein
MLVQQLEVGDDMVLSLSINDEQGNAALVIDPADDVDRLIAIAGPRV